MEPVVRGQRQRDLVVNACEATCLPKLTAPDAARDRRRVDVGAVVGVPDPVEELETPLGEGPAEVVAAGDELGDTADVPGVGAQLDVTKPLGDRARLAGRRSASKGFQKPFATSARARAALPSAARPSAVSIHSSTVV